MQEVLNLITGPATELVSLSDMHTHLRIDFDDDDGWITDAIISARIWAEAYLKRSFIARTYQWMLDYFPNRSILTPQTTVWDSWLNSRIYPYLAGAVIHVPKPPLMSVTSITYYDTNGNVQTLDSSQYLVYPGTPGRISPSVGNQYPATQDRLGSVTIEFVAGETSTYLSEALAIKMLVASWYWQREGTSDVDYKEVPMGVKSLLNATSSGFYV